MLDALLPQLKRNRRVHPGKLRNCLLLDPENKARIADVGLRETRGCDPPYPAS